DGDQARAGEEFLHYQSTGIRRVPVRSFFTINQGRATRATAGGRSNLDKGTLAAAHLGLVRAGQRPPDRRTAYGPPPLVKPAAPSARGSRKPDGSGAKAAGRGRPGRWPQWGMTGTGLAGASAIGRAPPGRSPTRSASAGPGGAAGAPAGGASPPPPRRWCPAVTRQPAPGTARQAAFDGGGPCSPRALTPLASRLH